MSANQKIIKKYLLQYAEPEARQILQNLENAPSLFTHYQQVIVIPAFDEDSRFIQRLQNNRDAKKTLVILVINQPEQSSFYQACKNNQNLYNDIILFTETVWQEENLTYCKSTNIDYICVDRFNENKAIPKKRGVGLARKIGADIALVLINHGVIKSNWIFSTDADTHLPANYFINDIKYSETENSAVVFDFIHTPSGDIEIDIATQEYEASIKYFRNALNWAGSPYAHYTLGSTLAISAPAYAKVRGFPQKSGGEDFYILNKLAKAGDVIFDPKVQIQIESRLSERVPFGTGPGVDKIVKLKNSNAPYNYYSLEIFKELKSFLENYPQLQNDSAAFDQLSVPVQQTLAELDLTKFLRHTELHANTPEKFAKQFHDWFDAFQTLRFIHILQRKYYPPKPLNSLLEEASILFNTESNI